MLEEHIPRHEADGALRSALRGAVPAQHHQLEELIRDMRACCDVLRVGENIRFVPPESLPPILRERVARKLGKIRDDARESLLGLVDHPVLGAIASSLAGIPPAREAKAERTQDQLRDAYLKHIRRELGLPDGLFSGMRYLSNHFRFIERTPCPFVTVTNAFPENILSTASEKFRTVPAALAVQHLNTLAKLPQNGTLIVLLRDVYNRKWKQWVQWTDRERQPMTEDEMGPHVQELLQPQGMFTDPKIGEAVIRCYGPVHDVLDDPAHPAVRGLNELTMELLDASPVTGTDPRTIRNDVDEYCRELPEEMTALLRRTMAGTEAVATDLFRALRDVDPDPTFRVDDLKHKTTKEEVTNFAAFLQTLLIISWKVKQTTDRAIDQAGRGKNQGLSLLARNTIRSSVCQSLLLAYVHRHYPAVFTPHEPTATRDQRSQSFGQKMAYLNSLIEYFETTMKPWVGPKANIPQKALADEAEDWLLSLRGFASLQFSALSQMPVNDPEPRAEIRLPPCPPPVRRTHLTAQTHVDGTVDQTAITTQYKLGYGHTVIHTTMPLDQAYTARFWMREPGAAPCHDPMTMIPLCEVLPPDTAATLYLAKKQARTDNDFNEWMEAAEDTNLDIGIPALRERHAEMNLITFMQMERGQTLGHASFFLLDAAEAEMAFGPGAYSVDSPDQREQIEILGTAGVPLYAQNAAVPWEISEGWDDLTEESSDERPLDEEEIRLHRVKDAMLRFTHSEMLTAGDVRDMLSAIGITVTTSKSGGGHYEFVSTRGKFTSPNKPVRDGEWYRHFVERIIIAVGDIDAFEHWVDAQKTSRKKPAANGSSNGAAVPVKTGSTH